MDGLLALITLGTVGYFLVWKDLIEPLLRAGSVKHSAPRAAFKLRSRRSARSNTLNGGSAQQNAKQEGSNVPNVQPPRPAGQPGTASESSSSEGFTLTPRELQQLAGAIAARAGGATVEEAIRTGFGAKKGASKDYVRAKELFDAATKAP